MSNDRLARSDILTGALDETDYGAVYAAVTATERGRWFLTEYANRNRHADTASLVAAMARIEAVLAANHGMAANKEVPANNVSSFDLAAAAERLLDIAFGLRERAADPALCDALDAAVREICQALVDAKPAAAQAAASSPALIAAAPVAAHEDDDGSPPQERTATTRDWHIDGPDFMFDRSSGEANSDHLEAGHQPLPAHPPPAGTPLPLRPSDDPDDLFEHSLGDAVAPRASVPASPVATPEPAATSEPARSTSAEVAPIAEATAAPRPRMANGAPAQATSRPPSCDPLADIRGLSEEELLALFG